MKSITFSYQTYLDALEEIEQLKASKKWIPITEGPPESGQRILVYWYVESLDLHQIELLTYYKKGDILENEAPPLKGGTTLNFLKDFLYGTRGHKECEEDGFYIYDCIDKTLLNSWRKHADCITHWMPLPKPPLKTECEENNETV